MLDARPSGSAPLWRGSSSAAASSRSCPSPLLLWCASPAAAASAQEEEEEEPWMACLVVFLFEAPTAVATVVEDVCRLVAGWGTTGGGGDATQGMGQDDAAGGGEYAIAEDHCLMAMGILEGPFSHMCGVLNLPPLAVVPNLPAPAATTRGQRRRAILTHCLHMPQPPATRRHP